MGEQVRHENYLRIIRISLLYFRTPLNIIYCVGLFINGATLVDNIGYLQNSKNAEDISNMSEAYLLEFLVGTYNLNHCFNTLILYKKLKYRA